MAVFFALRSHFAGPSERYLRRFDDADLLGWFRSHWSALAGDDDEAYERAQALLGCRLYGFYSLGVAIAQHGLAPPADMAEVGAILAKYLYVEGQILCSEHCLQVLTDDDELQLAYYFFDDAFLAEHGARAALLCHDGWRLPAEVDGARAFVPAVAGTDLAPGGDGAGTVWFVRLRYYDGSNLDLDGPLRATGVRLPDFAAWLAATEPRPGWEWPLEPRILRSQLLLAPANARDDEQAFLDRLLADPRDVATWAVYGDWLGERGRPRAGTDTLGRALESCARMPVASIGGGDWKERCCGSVRDARADASALRDEQGPQPHADAPPLVAVSEHLAQLCIRTGGSEARPLHHQYILFDDVWAGAHADLANALLTFASRWDVLSD